MASRAFGGIQEVILAHRKSWFGVSGMEIVEDCGEWIYQDTPDSAGWAGMPGVMHILWAMTF